VAAGYINKVAALAKIYSTRKIIWKIFWDFPDLAKVAAK